MKTKLFFIISFLMSGILNISAQQVQDRIFERILHFEQLKQKLQNRQVNTANIRLDSIVSKSYNSNNSSYSLNSLQAYLYDANDYNTNDSYNVWDANNNTMMQQSKTDYIYDSNGFITSETYFYLDFNTGTMIPSQRRLYTYNTNNQLTEMITQNYNSSSSAFDNFSKETYTYAQATDPMPDTILIEQWDAANNAWVLNQLGTITYNSNFKFTDMVVQNRDSGANTWVNDLHFTRTYDTNMRLTLHVMQNWDGAAWVNSSQRTYTYTPVGTDTNIIREFSSWVNSNWNVTGRTVTLIDANNQILLTEYYYLDNVSNTMIGSNKRIYNYNANVIVVENFQWDATNSDWATDSLSKIEYTYDMNHDKSDLILPYIYSNNTIISNTLFSTGLPSFDNFHHQILEEKYYSRPTAADPWIETYKSEYKYTDNTAGISEQNSIEAQVYPVPFDQYIQFKTESTDAYQINIMDVNGRVLYAGQHSNNEKIYLNGLSKGVYIYQVVTKTGQASGQIIKK